MIMGVPHPDPRVSRLVMVPRVDSLPAEGGKRCSMCGRVKPLNAFPPGTRCRTCKRHVEADRRAAEKVKPRTTEQATAAQRRWRATREGSAVERAWRESLPGRLSAHLATLRYRLRHVGHRSKRAARLRLRIAELIEARERYCG